MRVLARKQGAALVLPTQEMEEPDLLRFLEDSARA